MKNSLNYFLLALILSFFQIIFLNQGISFADDTSLGRTPEGVYPMSDADISMVSENVTVDIENGIVECVFNFKNSGGPKDVLMGFPGKLDEKGDNTEEANLVLHDFKSYVNNVEIPVNTEKGINPKNVEIPQYRHYSEWYTFSVHFGEGEEKQVKNTYSFRSTFNSIGHVFVGYILKTGAYWNDPIGYAKVTFKMGGIKPYEIKNLYPNNFRFEGNNLVWERSSFEPAYDLKVVYTVRDYSEEFLKSIADTEWGEQFLKEKEDFEALLKEIGQADNRQLLNCHKKAVSEEKPVLAQYIRSRLPSGSISNEKPEIIGMTVEQADNEDSSNIIIQVKDNYADQVYSSFKIYHFEDGKNVTDLEYQDLLNSYESRYITASRYNFIFQPGVEYEIEYSVRDSIDQYDEKSIKYIAGEDAKEKEKPAGNTGSTSALPDTKECFSLFIIIPLIISVILIFALIFIKKVIRLRN